MKRPARTTPDAGFTMIEMLIASAITMAVVGAIAAVITPAQAMLRAQDDAADLHQRMRAATDTMAGDLRAAVAVRPYRVGAVGDDGIAGIYYRPDTIGLVGVPSAPLSLDADAMRTYYLKLDAGTDSFELMRYDGGLSDLPLIQHVTRMMCVYLGASVPAASDLVVLSPAELVDGPWLEDSTHRRFDADLMRVRRVRLSLRFESTASLLRRLVPDEEIILQVAVRNIASGG